MDRSSDILDKVVYVFSALDESNNSPEMVAIAEKFYPRYSQYSDEVSMNPGLFKRVKYLYDNRDKLGLADDQKACRREVLQGLYAQRCAALDREAGRAQEIEHRTHRPIPAIQQNLLAATNAFSIVVDDAKRLSGLPQSSIDVAAEEAAGRGLKGKWVFTLHAPSRLPLLQYADDRDLRQQMYRAIHLWLLPASTTISQ